MQCDSSMIKVDKDSSLFQFNSAFISEASFNFFEKLQKAITSEANIDYKI